MTNFYVNWIVAGLLYLLTVLARASALVPPPKVGNYRPRMGRRGMGIAESDYKESNFDPQIYSSSSKTGFRIGRRQENDIFPAAVSQDEEEAVPDPWPIQLALEQDENTDDAPLMSDVVRNALQVYKILANLRQRQQVSD